MAISDQPSPLVRCYTVGGKVVRVRVQIGDVVHWKRNGSRGSFSCKVVGWSAARLQVLVTSWDGRPLELAQSRSIKPQVLVVYREGRRLDDADAPSAPGGNAAQGSATLRRAPGGTYCHRGLHFWSEAGDAERCCNPAWQRTLVFGGGTSQQCCEGVVVGRQWVRRGTA